MKTTLKTPVMPWTGAMLEINETGAVIGLAVVAQDSETERVINETVDRILPGWREAAGLLNPTQRS